MEKIFVRKEAGKKKNAFRVNSVADIPEFLRGTVTINQNTVYLVCREGNETCPLGSVIGYEESDETGTGWNTWVVGNAEENLVEKDGVFYAKATVLEAEAVSHEFPSFLEGAEIVHNIDGSWTIKTDWGQSTGFPGEAYWVRYGTKEDGKPDANILTKTEKSYQDYIVCEANGDAIGRLADIDPVY